MLSMTNIGKREMLKRGFSFKIKSKIPSLSLGMRKNNRRHIVDIPKTYPPLEGYFLSL